MEGRAGERDREREKEREREEVERDTMKTLRSAN